MFYFVLSAKDRQGYTKDAVYGTYSAKANAKGWKWP